MKLIVAAVIFLAACGSNPQPSTTPGGPQAPSAPAPPSGAKEGEAAVTLPDVPFDQLDHDQRIAFMKQKVMPGMKPLFQNHDGKKYAEFGCRTCHGEQAKQGHFDMPNGKLPKLNFNDMSKFKKEDIEWMHNDVLPAMAKLVGQEVRSKENPKGFGCTECHTLEGQ